MRGALVAVIFSAEDLARAARMRLSPDLFELRLDALVPILDVVEQTIPKLRAPLIITARHQSEGGARSLAPRIRRELLHRFLPLANFVDVELRACGSLISVWERAKQLGVQRIISIHDLQGTPAIEHLDKQLRRASRFAPDIFKLATRTDTPAAMARLLDFFDRHAAEQRIAAMGIGKLGRASRIALLLRGSALSYGFLGKRRIAGQLSITELRTRIRGLR